MGNAAGQLAYRFHLLRLAQGLLGRAQGLSALLNACFQGGIQGLQRGLRLAAFDDLARALGHFFHERDLFRRPAAGPALVEVDDGAKAAATQERHHQNGAGIHRGRRFARLLLVTDGIFEQISDHDRLARTELGDDFFAEGLRGEASEQGRHLAVGPANRVIEKILHGIEQAVADPGDGEMPPHQGAGGIQRRFGVGAAQQIAEFQHERVASVPEPTRRDVDGRTQGSKTSAVLVEEAATLRGHPAYLPVFFADGAELNVVSRSNGGIERPRERRARRFPIIRMQAGVEVLHAARHIG